MDAPDSSATDARPTTHVRFAGEDAVPRGLAVASAVMLRVGILAAGAILLGIAALRMLLLVLPVIVALFLATLLAPGAGLLERRGWRPAAAAGLVCLLATLVLLGLFALVVPAFVAQLGDLGTSVREGTERVARLLAPVGVSEGEVSAMLDRALADAQGSGREVAGGLLSGALMLAEWAAAIVLTLVLTFFFVKDGDRLWAWVVDLFGPRRRPAVQEIGARSWDALAAYVRGVAIVATVDAVLIGIALLAVGVPLALPLIVLTFLAAFFPIVGAVLAGAAAVLVALVAKGLVAALIVVAAILVVQQVEGNVLYPVVVGRRLRLHPVAILLALTAGGVLAGVPGAFLAVPLAAIAAAVLDYARVHDRRQAPILTPQGTPRVQRSLRV